MAQLRRSRSETKTNHVHRSLWRVALLVATAVVLFAPARGQAGIAPAIAFDPSSHDYGTIDSGATSAQTFVVRNDGFLPTLRLKVSLAGSSAFTKTADTCVGRFLWPRKPCSITVQYAPSSPGSTDSGSLTVSGLRVSATATLTGKSTPPASADISLAYSSLSFLSVTNNSPVAATVTVRVAANDKADCHVNFFDFGGWSKTPTAAVCEYDFTSLLPIASGSSLTIRLQAMILDGHAEVWSSSLPDPDSTPGNGQSAEDDYVSIPSFLWD